MVRKHGIYKSENAEKIIVFILFVLSLPNTMLLLVSSLFVSWYLIKRNQNGVGCIKALVFITIRTIINSGIGVRFSSLGLIKWFLIFGLSTLIIIVAKKHIFNENRSFFYTIALFATYVIFISFFNSDYPIVSVFKAFSWVFVFGSISIGIYNNPKYSWLNYLTWPLNTLVFLSPLSVLLGVAYLRNGHGFQGLVNHPNMLGIITSITFAMNIYLLQEKKERYRIIFLVLCVIECVLSESRTGVLSIAISLVIYFSFNLQSGWKKIGIILLTIITSIILYQMGFWESVISFLYKGQSTGNMLYSRETQIARALEKFYLNPLFGSGFMVPTNGGLKSYAFSFDVSVEPGNLIFALIGDLGIIGTIFFIIPYFWMFIFMDKRKSVIFCAPFIASMGEMIFFSTNNIAIIYYIMFGYCLINGKRFNRNLV